jgi:GNAT superfamily N-acetyltransferase
MGVRLARPSEAEETWVIRNLALRHGCHGVYDADALAAFTPEVMPAGYFRAIEENPFYVVEAHGQLVATGFLDLQQQSVEAIFTRPGCEGQGYASAIMTAIKHEARRRGFPALTLSATPNAAGFYLRHGFIRLRDSEYFSARARRHYACVEMRWTADDV